MAARVRFVGGGIFSSVVIAVLGTPYWWVVPLSVLSLAVVAIVALLLLIRLHERMATKTDVTEWSLFHWKRRDPPSKK